MKLRTYITIGSLALGAWRAMRESRAMMRTTVKDGRKTIRKGLKRAARSI